MLHPHVPDDVKHFAKHLFATFLGLLMALGLESWHEHRRETRLAEQALASVETELGDNLSHIDRQIARCEVSIQMAQTLERYFDDLIDAKRRGKPLPPFPKLTELGVWLDFHTDAWETFKNLGVLRHVSPERARRLSMAYFCISALRQGLDAHPLQRQIPASIYLLMEDPEQNVPKLDVPQLERMRDGAQSLRLLYRWCKIEMVNLRSACDTALKP